eukprot:748800-Hanusia_phi.AAC.4
MTTRSRLQGHRHGWLWLHRARGTAVPHLFTFISICSMLAAPCCSSSARRAQDRLPPGDKEMEGGERADGLAARALHHRRPVECSHEHGGVELEGTRSLTAMLQYDTSKDGRIDFDEYCVVGPYEGEVSGGEPEDRGAGGRSDCC